MGDDDIAEGAPLPAGTFSAWLSGMGRALDGAQPTDVPCDGCLGHDAGTGHMVVVEPEPEAVRALLPGGGVTGRVGN